MLSVEQVRQQFPALQYSTTVFLENAGGSQLPEVVIHAMAEFMRTSYAQSGSPYPESERVTQMIRDAHTYVNRLFNGEGIGHVAIGQSATALMYMLGNSLGATLKEGDEVIVSVTNHESHIGPWVRLQDRGVKVIWWQVDPESGLSSLDDLRGILTDRTRVVAFSRTSNLVGDIVDVRAVTDLAHSVGATVVCDAVASASHESLDVAAWGCDYCVISHHKVYGPHVGSLFGRTEAWERLNGPNHFFLPAQGSAHRFELGCLSYEGLAGILALAQYLGALIGEIPDGSRSQIERAFRRMSSLEEGPKRTLLGYLVNRGDLRLLGTTGDEPRHPTFSFVHPRLASDDVAKELGRRGLGIKSGHMYAYRLCEALGISTDTGVIRVSAVHYNSHEEIERLIATLEEVL